MSRSRVRRLSLCAVPAVLATMTACTLQGGGLPEPQDYACTWQSDVGGHFELIPDGRATVSISSALLASTESFPELEESELFQSDATWTIGNGAFYLGQDGVPQLQLSFMTADGPRSWIVDVDGRDKAMTLLSPRTDADDTDRTVFTPSNCLRDEG